MPKEFYENGFDKSTKTKVEIFDRYFNEAFPVFVHSPGMESIYICDFFAGQGKDKLGNYGTSLNILDSIKEHCDSVVKKNKKVFLIFNDMENSSFLSKNVNEFLENCKNNCKVIKCIFALNNNLYIRDKDFKDYFYQVYDILKNQKSCPKIIFIDPFGIVISDDIFLKLIDLPKTDFICFIPSSYLYRFKEQLNTYNVDFENEPANKSHKIIAKYFEEQIPKNKEYYISYFSIKKGSNYYGLIFGTNHTLGAEKFLKICWDIDKISGEADYNINRDLCYYGVTLFPEHNTSIKLKDLSSELENKILNRTIITNREAYIFGLKRKCLPKHVTEIIKGMISNSLIAQINTNNSNIHKLDVQNFVVIHP